MALKGIINLNSKVKNPSFDCFVSRLLNVCTANNNPKNYLGKDLHSNLLGSVLRFFCVPKMMIFLSDI